MAESQPDSTVFSVRIVSIDHYMAPPIPDYDICYSSFQGGKVHEVPVIRVYGSTPAGQKTCLHIHRVLPYLYVPCADIPLQPNQEGDSYTHAISLALEKALTLKGNAGLKRQHVHGCNLVRAKKFYGFHASEELFVKIYLYYPHDVSRAANLLLGGAVLDKSLQPHESHIPFILQFLVDYNLYGMGHLHLSKVKFRHPVPDVFSPRKFNNSSQHGNEMDKLNRTSADFQADSSGSTCLSSPLWVSSTIPGDWVWQLSSDLDGSPNQDIYSIKRQSICELEGDATLDDIVNQQFKMYTSLSQTRSDVKMVQSLIPIWEEEYERTGMHEAAIHPDPGKPLPQDVLKTLSLGLEFENVLMKLCGAREENLVELGLLNANYTDPEHLICLKERNNIASLSPQSLPHGEEMGTTPSEGKDTCPILLSGGEVQSSEIIGTSSPKASDTEALGILRWLATSQAARDLNSDDELLPETILSPLLPATTIDKVLEKANIEYERESQQECQDILDSIEDVIDFDGPEERASHSVDHSNRPQTSSEQKIPQVDGSNDDLYLFPCTRSAENSSEIETKSQSKSSFQHRAPLDTGTNSANKDKTNKTLWGTLPFSVTSKVSDNLETVNFNVTDAGVSGSKECRGTSFLAENDLGKCSAVLMKNEDADAYDVKEASSLTGGSVRDLMRRKRCYRVEPLECGSLRVKRAHMEGEQKEGISLRPKQLDFHTLHKDELENWPLESSNLGPSCTNQKTEFHEAGGSRPTYSDCSVYYKPALVSSNDSPLSSVHKGKKEIPMPFNPKNEDSAVFEGHCEACKGEEADFRSTSTAGKNSTVNSSRSDSSFDVQLLKSDAEVKLLKDERLQQTDAAGASCFTWSDSLVERELFSLDGLTENCGQEGETSMEGVHDMSSEKLVGKDTTNDATVLQDEKCIGGEQGRDSGLSVFGCSGSTIVTMEAQHVDLFGMTFCKKAPSADCKDGALENAFCSPTIPDHPYLVNKENHEGGSVQGRPLDESLPFFVPDCEEREFKSNCVRNRDSNSLQEVVMGVPTHYLNDGSHLYILTPVLSPPSVDSVYRWLLRDDEGASGERNAAVEPSSPEDSSDTLTSSQILLHDDCNKALTESGSHLRPVLEEVHQETDGMLKAELNPHWNGATAMLPSEDHTAEVGASSDGLQDISQISGPDGRSRSTPLSQIGFRDPASLGAGQQLTLLSIEIQAGSRGDLRPDPRYDAINVVALAFQNDNDSVVEVHVLFHCNVESCQRNLDGIPDCKVLVFSEEKHLFSHFIKIFCSFDPDILMGWDIQGGSLGFLAERAAHLGIGLLNDISRVPLGTKIAAGDLEIPEKGIPDNLQPDSFPLEDAVIEDDWGRTHASGVHVGGRIVLNVWRLMRSEVKLTMYTVEAVTEAVLRRKIPSIPYKVLTRWFSSGPGRARYRCIEYVAGRAKLNLEIMHQLDMINRTSELARVFGIDFFSVLSRGSQYRVESMFLRLAHSQNYLAISPGNQQVASQPAMECIPLVMEPESGFYADPVVVLDFQSLYPSMIIAYNLCFCTCLGKVLPSREKTLGVSPFSPDPLVLRDLKDQILLTPNGVMYVLSEARKGVLPRLLEEILSTRIMVKQAMKKLAPSQQVLHRIFNARQLALKLISNVTYGYTAAGFSGRMPCAELADSIVQCGRSTLEKAISFVNANDKWKAKVIYGDTDSMFVLLKGRAVKEAFRIGHEIASEITAMNPNPVTLKMEKVYHGCFLLTKKRYVGYSYESPDQTEPIFDAKGIETVRRDTCGAVAKMMEQSLRLFFEHPDISEVKAYLQRQWTRILSGRVSLQDFVFAKEVRLGTYSTRSSSLPPAAIVATKALRADPRAEPRYAERVPYVVIHGEPGARLVDMVVDPLDLLAIDSPYRLNDLYYINKQIIPALQRVFGLVGADLNHWFSEMPRPGRESLAKRPVYAADPRRSRIDFYYLSKHCVVCGELVQSSAHLCDKCAKKESTAAVVVIGSTSKLERETQHLAAICRHCGGGDWVVESGVKCTSLACSVFYERRKVQKELQGLSAVAAEMGLYPKCNVEWF